MSRLEQKQQNIGQFKANQYKQVSTTEFSHIINHYQIIQLTSIIRFIYQIQQNQKFKYILSHHMNQQQQQSKSNCYLQRPNSPKMESRQFMSNSKKTSLSMSIGGNQVASNFISPYRIKPEFAQYTISDTTLPSGNYNYDKLQLEFKTISKQNLFLREQNSQLKKQLLRLRKDLRQSVRSADKYSVSFPANNDLRGTIKKQMGEMKQLGLKFDMLSKQCKMYQEINEKMEQRIKCLTLENKKCRTEVEELQGELGKFDHLKEKCNTLMKLYNNLESKFNSDQLQWMKWKQGWLAEKEYYYKRIQQLQKEI